MRFLMMLVVGLTGAFVAACGGDDGKSTPTAARTAQPSVAPPRCRRRAPGLPTGCPLL
jgi:hypothetical protein